VFFGEYRHTLDPKGRVVLPADFRDELADGCVVTKGQEKCLYVFTLARWGEEVEKLTRLPRTKKTVRDYQRVAFSGARVQEPDRQGRVSVPEVLREYAHLERDVVVIGVADLIEIWDQETWEAFSVNADENYSSIEEELGTEGI
jgi:MraZ protein